MSAARTPHVRHGVDLVHVSKLRRMLAERPQMKERLFTADERTYCESHADPAPHYGARFAAKEAALKALGFGITALGVDARLREIEVVRKGTAPVLALHGRSAREAQRLGVVSTSVSLTHDGDHAMATVLLVTEGVA